MVSGSGTRVAKTILLFFGNSKEKELIVETTMAPFYLESRSAQIESVFSK